MKNLFCLVIAALFVTQGCKKTSADINDNAVHGPQTLPGEWELRSLTGGLGPTGGSDYQPGNGNKWKLSDSTYWLYTNNIATDSGAYKISSDINPQTTLETSALLLNGTVYPLYFSIANDSLTIYRGVVAADGTIEKYVRIKNQ